MNDEIGRDQIDANLASVRTRITQAAGRAGRHPDDVRLVAVTKGFPILDIRQAYELGLRHFGENRVEEAIPKLDELSDLAGVVWHMVGHVQSRKAGAVAPRFDLVHSVDSMKLAQRLARFAGDAGRRLPVLLECNVSGEQSKSGLALWQRQEWPRVLPLFGELLALQNLEVRGLMTMAPYTVDETIVRPVFRRLRELRDYL